VGYVDTRERINTAPNLRNEVISHSTVSERKFFRIFRRPSLFHRPRGHSTTEVDARLSEDKLKSIAPGIDDGEFQISNINCWNSIPYYGHLPGERSGHAMISVAGKAYLFGGCGGNGNTCLADLLSYDFHTSSWKRLSTVGLGPGPRASFAISKGPDENSIIIAGGTRSNEVCGDLFEFNLQNMLWKRLATSSYCQYYGQSVCAYKQGLVFFGGSSGQEYTNDVVFFDLENKEFAQLQTTGIAPSKRYKHQGIIIRNDLYIIGGGNYKPSQSEIDLYVLNLESLVWTRLCSTGKVPQGRVAHSCEYDEKSDKIFLWGGFDWTLKRWNDFYCLDLASRVWSCLSERMLVCPSPRAFQSSFIWNNSIFIFGGADGAARHSDLWKFQLRVDPPSLMFLAASAVFNKCCYFSEQLEVLIAKELLDGVESIDLGIDKFHA